MRNFKIYLAGKMGGLTPQYARELRDKIEHKLLVLSKYSNTKVDVCNPCNFYNFEDSDLPQYDSEEEVRNYDLWRVRHSDLIIVVFIGDGKSQGTTAELTLAKELHIPIIGVNEGHIDIHPWDEVCVDKMFDDYEKMCDYINDFYLV